MHFHFLPLCFCPLAHKFNHLEPQFVTSTYFKAEPHSSVGSVADLRTGGRWFDPWLSQYSVRGLMIVISTGFIPLSPLSIASAMGMWGSSQWIGNNIVQSTG